MAHSLSAKKRIRQNEKRRLANRGVKSRLRTEVKKLLVSIEGKDLDSAAKQISIVASALDKAAKTSAMHRNTASRKKSRLQRRLNAARAAGQTQPA